MKFNDAEYDRLNRELIDDQGGDPGHEVGDAGDADTAIEAFIQNAAQSAMEIVCDIKGVEIDDRAVFDYITARVRAVADAMTQYPLT